mmetsp:Transcript_2096/g.6231  ORF Transcript_2096/g.6231 Transcript_2096/m.6231 type:complete len:375 (-) Transcript_2096:937-2061(-)
MLGLQQQLLLLLLLLLLHVLLLQAGSGDGCSGGAHHLLLGTHGAAELCGVRGGSCYVAVGSAAPAAVERLGHAGRCVAVGGAFSPQRTHAISPQPPGVGMHASRVAPHVRGLLRKRHGAISPDVGAHHGTAGHPQAAAGRPQCAAGGAQVAVSVVVHCRRRRRKHAAWEALLLLRRRGLELRKSCAMHGLVQLIRLGSLPSTSRSRKPECTVRLGVRLLPLLVRRNTLNLHGRGRLRAAVEHGRRQQRRLALVLALLLLLLHELLLTLLILLCRHLMEPCLLFVGLLALGGRQVLLLSQLLQHGALLVLVRKLRLQLLSLLCLHAERDIVSEIHVRTITASLPMLHGLLLLLLLLQVQVARLRHQGRPLRDGMW